MKHTNGLGVCDRNGHLKVLKYLVNEVGCDPNERNAKGETAAHISARRGEIKVLRYLNSLGADMWVLDHEERVPFDHTLLGMKLNPRGCLTVQAYLTKLQHAHAEQA